MSADSPDQEETYYISSQASGNSTDRLYTSDKQRNSERKSRTSLTELDLIPKDISFRESGNSFQESEDTRLNINQQIPTAPVVIDRHSILPLPHDSSPQLSPDKVKRSSHEHLIPTNLRRDVSPNNLRHTAHHSEYLESSGDEVSIIISKQLDSLNSSRGSQTSTHEEGQKVFGCDNRTEASYRDHLNIARDPPGDHNLESDDIYEIQDSQNDNASEEDEFNALSYESEDLAATQSFFPDDDLSDSYLVDVPTTNLSTITEVSETAPDVALPPPGNPKPVDSISASPLRHSLGVPNAPQHGSNQFGQSKSMEKSAVSSNRDALGPSDKDQNIGRINLHAQPSVSQPDMVDAQFEPLEDITPKQDFTHRNLSEASSGYQARIMGQSHERNDSRLDLSRDPVVKDDIPTAHSPSNETSASSKETLAAKMSEEAPDFPAQVIIDAQNESDNFDNAQPDRTSHQPRPFILEDKEISNSNRPVRQSNPSHQSLEVRENNGRFSEDRVSNTEETEELSQGQPLLEEEGVEERYSERFEHLHATSAESLKSSMSPDEPHEIIASSAANPFTPIQGNIGVRELATTEDAQAHPSPVEKFQQAYDVSRQETDLASQVSDNLCTGVESEASTDPAVQFDSQSRSNTLIKHLERHEQSNESASIHAEEGASIERPTLPVEDVPESSEKAWVNEDLTASIHTSESPDRVARHQESPPVAERSDEIVDRFLPTREAHVPFDHSSESKEYLHSTPSDISLKSSFADDSMRGNDREFLPGQPDKTIAENPTGISHESHEQFSDRIVRGDANATRFDESININLVPTAQDEPNESLATSYSTNPVLPEVSNNHSEKSFPIDQPDEPIVEADTPHEAMSTEENSLVEPLDLPATVRSVPSLSASSLTDIAPDAINAVSGDEETKEPYRSISDQIPTSSANGYLSSHQGDVSTCVAASEINEEGTVTTSGPYEPFVSTEALEKKITTETDKVFTSVQENVDVKVSLSPNLAQVPTGPEVALLEETSAFLTPKLDSSSEEFNIANAPVQSEVPLDAFSPERNLSDLGESHEQITEAESLRENDTVENTSVFNESPGSTSMQTSADAQVNRDEAIFASALVTSTSDGSETKPAPTTLSERNDGTLDQYEEVIDLDTSKGEFVLTPIKPPSIASSARDSGSQDQSQEQEAESNTGKEESISISTARHSDPSDQVSDSRETNDQFQQTPAQLAISPENATSVTSHTNIAAEDVVCEVKDVSHGTSPQPFDTSVSTEGLMLTSTESNDDPSPSAEDNSAPEEDEATSHSVALPEQTPAVIEQLPETPDLPGDDSSSPEVQDLPASNQTAPDVEQDHTHLVIKQTQETLNSPLDSDIRIQAQSPSVIEQTVSDVQEDRPTPSEIDPAPNTPDLSPGEVTVTGDDKAAALAQSGSSNDGSSSPAPQRKASLTEVDDSPKSQPASNIDQNPTPPNDQSQEVPTESILEEPVIPEEAAASSPIEQAEKIPDLPSQDLAVTEGSSSVTENNVALAEVDGSSESDRPTSNVDVSNVDVSNVEHKNTTPPPSDQSPEAPAEPIPEKVVIPEMASSGPIEQVKHTADLSSHDLTVTEDASAFPAVDQSAISLKENSSTIEESAKTIDLSPDDATSTKIDYSTVSASIVDVTNTSIPVEQVQEVPLFPDVETPVLVEPPPATPENVIATAPTDQVEKTPDLPSKDLPSPADESVLPVDQSTPSTQEDPMIPVAIEQSPEINDFSVDKAISREIDFPSRPDQPVLNAGEDPITPLTIEQSPEVPIDLPLADETSLQIESPPGIEEDATASAPREKAEETPDLPSEDPSTVNGPPLPLDQSIAQEDPATPIAIEHPAEITDSDNAASTEIDCPSGAAQLSMNAAEVPAPLLEKEQVQEGPDEFQTTLPVESPPAIVVDATTSVPTEQVEETTDSPAADLPPTVDETALPLDEPTSSVQKDLATPLTLEHSPTIVDLSGDNAASTEANCPPGADQQTLNTEDDFTTVLAKEQMQEGPAESTVDDETSIPTESSLAIAEDTTASAPIEQVVDTPDLPSEDSPAPAGESVLPLDQSTSTPRVQEIECPPEADPLTVNVEDDPTDEQEVSAELPPDGETIRVEPSPAIVDDATTSDAIEKVEETTDLPSEDPPSTAEESPLPLDQSTPSVHADPVSPIAIIADADNATFAENECPTEVDQLTIIAVDDPTTALANEEKQEGPAESSVDDETSMPTEASLAIAEGTTASAYTKQVVDTPDLPSEDSPAPAVESVLPLDQSIPSVQASTEIECLPEADQLTSNDGGDHTDPLPNEQAQEGSAELPVDGVTPTQVESSPVIVEDATTSDPIEKAEETADLPSENPHSIADESPLTLDQSTPSAQEVPAAPFTIKQPPEITGADNAASTEIESPPGADQSTPNSEDDPADSLPNDQAQEGSAESPVDEETPQVESPPVIVEDATTSDPRERVEDTTDLPLEDPTSTTDQSPLPLDQSTPSAQEDTAAPVNIEQPSEIIDAAASTENECPPGADQSTTNAGDDATDPLVNEKAQEKSAEQVESPLANVEDATLIEQVEETTDLPSEDPPSTANGSTPSAREDPAAPITVGQPSAITDADNTASTENEGPPQADQLTVNVGDDPTDPLVNEQAQGSAGQVESPPAIVEAATTSDPIEQAEETTDLPSENPPSTADELPLPLDQSTPRGQEIECPPVADPLTVNVGDDPTGPMKNEQEVSAELPPDGETIQVVPSPAIVDDATTSDAIENVEETTDLPSEDPPSTVEESPLPLDQSTPSIQEDRAVPVTIKQPPVITDADNPASAEIECPPKADELTLNSGDDPTDPLPNEPAQEGSAELIVDGESPSQVESPPVIVEDATTSDPIEQVEETTDLPSDDPPSIADESALPLDQSTPSVQDSAAPVALEQSPETTDLSRDNASSTGINCLAGSDALVTNVGEDAIPVANEPAQESSDSLDVPSEVIPSPATDQIAASVQTVSGNPDLTEEAEAPSDLPPANITVAGHESEDSAAPIETPTLPADNLALTDTESSLALDQALPNVDQDPVLSAIESETSATPIEQPQESSSTSSTPRQSLPVDQESFASPATLIYHSSFPAFLDSPAPSMISTPKPPVDPAAIARFSSAPPAVSNIKREIILPAKMKKISLISQNSSQSLVLTDLTEMLTSPPVESPIAQPIHPQESQKTQSNVASAPILSRRSDDLHQSISPASCSRTKSMSGRNKLTKPYPSLKPTLSTDNPDQRQKRSSSRSVTFRAAKDKDPVTPTRKNSRAKSLRLGEFGLRLKASKPRASHLESSNDLADAFAFIEMSETMTYNPKADRYVNPTLSRRLSKSVKSMLNKYHDRGLPSKSSPLDDIDIPADFHLDIDHELANLSDEHGHTDDTAQGQTVGLTRSEQLEGAASSSAKNDNLNSKVSTVRNGVDSPQTTGQPSRAGTIKSVKST